MMFCKACGESIMDDCKFCPQCGENLQVVASLQKKNETIDKVKGVVETVASEVGSEIAKENLAKVEKVVKKKAKKITHKALVKLGVEKKNLADVVDDFKKRR
ncbi:MAG: zinc ribbon domain-containing protein [Lachnospiraceae bacterium]|nr:zinc ribbon domain-containing protein [Lachnospiraceae bacterium]